MFAARTDKKKELDFFLTLDRPFLGMLAEWTFLGVLEQITGYIRLYWV